MKLKIYFAFISIITIINCTTIGFHREGVRSRINFGEPANVKVCVIREKGVTKEEADELFSEWNKELKLYNIQVSLPKSIEMERPGFFGGDIINYLLNLKLSKDCDRFLYLKGRTGGDIAFEIITLGIFAISGLKLEVQGAVEVGTQTRGYIKAKYISLLQLLFTSPASTLIHEGYHLLGCGHQLFMDDCYMQIKKSKDLLSDKDTEKDFFPIITVNGNKFQRREDVNRAIE